MSSYLLFGYGPFAYFLLNQLEFHIPDNATAKIDADIAVILTGFAEADPSKPALSRINSASAYRVLEARKLYSSNTNLRFIISGNAQIPSLLKEALIATGIPAANIDTETKSSNTFESAVNCSSQISTHNFYLITSAGHMPRAYYAFQKQGLKPVAVPTHYLSKQNIFAAQNLPSAYFITVSDHAVHELLALLWYKLTGKI
ncbi:MAG: YdcF family protein [Gammaproteobacteria bacterium]|nr:YdcF family protein [Gammaproteobacteria bacterium]